MIDFIMIDLIDSEILELNKKADEDLKDVFDELDRICLINSERVLSAFIENQVSYTDFADINGYGNYDAGRDKLEKIFATVLGWSVRRSCPVPTLCIWPFLPC